jgi:hypothetical protein
MTAPHRFAPLSPLGVPIVEDPELYRPPTGDHHHRATP